MVENLWLSLLSYWFSLTPCVKGWERGESNTKLSDHTATVFTGVYTGKAKRMAVKQPQSESRLSLLSYCFSPTPCVKGWERGESNAKLSDHTATVFTGVGNTGKAKEWL